MAVAKSNSHFAVRQKNKPPLFGVSQMGEVARHSRVGGGENAPSVG